MDDDKFNRLSSLRPDLPWMVSNSKQVVNWAKSINGHEDEVIISWAKHMAGIGQAKHIEKNILNIYCCSKINNIYVGSQWGSTVENSKT